MMALRIVVVGQCMSRKVDRKHRRRREQPGSCRQIPDSRLESGSEPKARPSCPSCPSYHVHACSPANLHFFLEPSRPSKGTVSILASCKDVRQPRPQPLLCQQRKHTPHRPLNRPPFLLRSQFWLFALGYYSLAPVSLWYLHQKYLCEWAWTTEPRPWVGSSQPQMTRVVASANMGNFQKPWPPFLLRFVYSRRQELIVQVMPFECICIRLGCSGDTGKVQRRGES